MNLNDYAQGCKRFCFKARTDKVRTEPIKLSRQGNKQYNLSKNQVKQKPIRNV